MYVRTNYVPLIINSPELTLVPISARGIRTCGLFLEYNFVYSRFIFILQLDPAMFE